MKKVLLMVAALLIVFSGVAAVSAYEGHLVNVKAHLENAIAVADVDYELDFGLVFPQDWLQKYVSVGLSESFMSQEADDAGYSTVIYQVYWEYKPIDWVTYPDTCDPDDDDMYTPIWDYIDLEVNGGNVLAVVEMESEVDDVYVQKVGGDYYLDWNNPCDEWHLVFNVPVFEDFYNIYTDPIANPGIIDMDDACMVPELICGVTVDVPHADLGGDLKFQVIGYGVHVPEPIIE